MKSLTLSFIALATLAVAVPTLETRANDKAQGPVVDLGAAGKYHGVLQNNGTVASWKAIPYAAPPVGELRFKPPTTLAKQNGSLVDVSQDFPGIPTACVQFGTTQFVGVNAGPGQEDCLKLWVWAPAGAKKGDKLPVQVYTHGGGIQNSQSPNNDFSDWVGQDKRFIAVNANYRLGALGYFNSANGEVGNAGLLDARFAIQWVQKNIDQFGGDPKAITISGQSGGAGIIMDQLVAFDGKNPPFQQAIPRSIQRHAAWTVQDLIPRNDAFAASLNCSQSSATKSGANAQLKCLRALSAETIRLGALAFSATKQPDGFSWPGFLPGVDGQSITDRPTKLFAEGKFADVPLLIGNVGAEFARLVGPLPTNFTAVITSSIGNQVTPSIIDQLTRVYPEPIANYSANTNTFQDSQHRALALMDEMSWRCAAPMIARAAKKRGQDVYQYQFEVGQPGIPEYLGSTHSADNFALQNATSSYASNATMVDLAHEWRAYLSSFIRHGDPNKEKLSTAPTWYQTSAEYRYQPRLIPAYAQQSAPLAGTSGAAPTNTGMQQMDAAQWDRCSYWYSDSISQVTRQ